ncbi:hypothetical protein [Nitriliruptor alkaliphilus]|uniref:hypothetical protein n=1 Tax=Nitriliruptor alkaliphilus TaxID=427918 RepID=UPI00069804F1|nr:hypothetical protein [Nitriliruptor alkaliphilus]
MLASVHLADLGTAGALRTTASRLREHQVPGLRWGTTALAMPLAMNGSPPTRRAAVIGFWDTDEALDAFVRGHRVGQRFADGFEARLRPLRAHGAWPGLPTDVPATRNVAHEGPVVVVTMSWLRLSRLGAFTRASRPAEETALADDGLLWATAAVRLPFAATISVWRDTRAAVTYAYQRERPEHPAAIDADRRRTFNRRSTFIRLAPIQARGEVGGDHPLTAATLGEMTGPTSTPEPHA